MNQTFYLERTLTTLNNEHVYTEAELLSASDYIVVLAEPGAGKTELMKSLARKLDTLCVSASLLMHLGEADEQNKPLVIDAVDEIATIEKSGIQKLFVSVRKSKPKLVVMSGRSSEWENGSTSLFEQFIGHAPLLVYLKEFNQEEQKQVFENYAPGKNFNEFWNEVERFNLDVLLSNPQFLQLFAEAYIQSKGHFSDKSTIFSLAIDGLAKEANTDRLSCSSSLTHEQKILISSEVFTKLFLSGSEGVNSTKATENRIYPVLSSLVNGDAAAYEILSTRLFKPGECEGQHRPTHKIVAEYCAANYLVKRIISPTDALTLSVCLPQIAPNGVSRDELRGLLGWMATLGNRAIRESVIALDAYAVLANGDPSQFDSASKKQLIRKLKQLDISDPYFRRGDYLRRFSVSDFFTRDIIDEIKPFLIKHNDGHLRDLILDLLSDSPVVAYFFHELFQLVIDSNEPEYTRFSAAECLVKIKGYDLIGVLGVLIFEASNVSLSIAADIIEGIGIDKFNIAFLSGYLCVCANLYPNNNVGREGATGRCYFIKNLINYLPSDILEPLMDKLTSNLQYTSGYESSTCDCRNGISKIIGMIIDRYFELIPAPYEPAQIWNWLKNLNFHQQIRMDDSISVQVLHTDKILRQGIISYVFSPLKDRGLIKDMKFKIFRWGRQAHSGLNLSVDDYEFILNLAFNIKNVTLWGVFLQSHTYDKNKEKLINICRLRRVMRLHAISDISFMKEWSLFNKRIKSLDYDTIIFNKKHKREERRYNNSRNNIVKSNINYINNNEFLIKSGKDWWSLCKFSELILMEPDKIKLEVGNEELVRVALINCIDFISPEVPDLKSLARLRCDSKIPYPVMILYAACLEVFRKKGNLDSVPPELLPALRISTRVNYKAVSAGEYEELKSEIDRIIFHDNDSKEIFLRNYIEPQLNRQYSQPEIGLLKYDDIFIDLRGKLSSQWIDSFTELPMSVLDELFDIAIKYGCRYTLNNIINKKCLLLKGKMEKNKEDKDVENEHIFWLIRAFCFLDKIDLLDWDLLKSNKDNIFYLYNKLGHINRNEYKEWPKLSALKVEMVLDAFYEQWPAVELPSSWGSHSPKGETAYRFLTDLVWMIGSDSNENTIPVLNRLLKDNRFLKLHSELKSIQASLIRTKALVNFEPQTPKDIVDLLDFNEVITVEGLRALVIEELNEFQRSISGGEFNSINLFYEKGERRDEVRSTEVIAERLSIKLAQKNISVVSEHQLKNYNRSDFTVSKMIGSKRRLLVTEVKGQWHRELYTAAAAQLYDRYSIHPDAELQGIFLVLWFGEKERVAGRKNHGIKTAKALQTKIQSKLPLELVGFIDIIVLDVSN